VFGGAHILAYGLIEKENISKFIGGAFMVGPSLSLGNLVHRGMQDSHRERMNPDARIHFLSVTDPKEDAQKHEASTLKPLVDEQGRFQFDSLTHMMDMAKKQQMLR
jgi:hypothetical protein